jgi:hypothetical protein
LSYSFKGKIVRRVYLVLILCFIAILLPAILDAQSTTFLSLETATTSLQTGQSYEVNIRLGDAAEVWLADMQISYDPSMIYVMGTKSGSPITQGILFNPGASAVIRNEVKEGLVFYTLSMLTPAEPINGSGVIGTLRIYPLAPGQTQLTFSRGELSKAIFEVRDGQRVGVGSEELAFTPVLLDLIISGQAVEPPSEATATPLPTETPIAAAAGIFPTEEPTLVNVTAAPRTPEILATLEVPTADTGSRSSLPLILAIVVMLIGGIGTVITLMLIRRRK